MGFFAGDFALLVLFFGDDFFGIPVASQLFIYKPKGAVSVITIQPDRGNSVVRIYCNLYPAFCMFIVTPPHCAVHQLRTTAKRAAPLLNAKIESLHWLQEL